MSRLTEILEHNRRFVADKGYAPYQTSNLPDKKLVVISCMDTRLVELLPKAMNLKNGDANVIKVAGAMVGHPFGHVMQSVLVAVYNLGAEEVCVVGHHRCGMAATHAKTLLETMKSRGIPAETLDTLAHSGIRLEEWLAGFSDVRAEVRKSVATIRSHPLLPPGVKVHGLVADPDTGELELVESGD
ncbi:beta-class carbonic anhydrase [Alicyclobacillus kakegawensis]|uniref:beta-class carbonic anhydrase n=1 Tax=Alicyclobacillus kakegawensis TaxID=392012 RepID=UPI0008323ABF|nr:carbonic anhydrase [Alicyclobacillus kakegawensis]